MMNLNVPPCIATSNLKSFNSRLNNLDKLSSFVIISFSYEVNLFDPSKTIHSAGKVLEKIKFIAKHKMQSPKFVTFHKINSRNDFVNWIIIESKYGLSFTTAFVNELYFHINFRLMYKKDFESLKLFTNRLLEFNF